MRLFYSCIGHIYVPNVAYISPISVPYIVKIKVIFLLFEFGKNVKNSLVLIGFPGLDDYLRNLKSVFDDVKSKVDIVNVLIKTNSVGHGLGTWVLIAI